MRKYITPSEFSTDYPIQGHDHTMTITYWYTQGTKAKLSGPPESCYPAEDPEVEILSITDGEGGDLEQFLDEDDWNNLEQRIIDHENALAAKAREDFEADRARDKELWKDY